MESIAGKTMYWVSGPSHSLSDMFQQQNCSSVAIAVQNGCDDKREGPLTCEACSTYNVALLELSTDRPNIFFLWKGPPTFSPQHLYHAEMHYSTSINNSKAT